MTETRTTNQQIGSPNSDWPCELRQDHLTPERIETARFEVLASSPDTAGTIPAR